MHHGAEPGVCDSCHVCVHYGFSLYEGGQRALRALDCPNRHSRYSRKVPPALARFACSELVSEFNGEVAHGVPAQSTSRLDHASEGAIGINNNNYARAEGQNVG